MSISWRLSYQDVQVWTEMRLASMQQELGIDSTKDFCVITRILFWYLSQSRLMILFTYGFYELLHYTHTKGINKYIQPVSFKYDNLFIIVQQQKGKNPFTSNLLFLSFFTSNLFAYVFQY